MQIYPVCAAAKNSPGPDKRGIAVRSLLVAGRRAARKLSPPPFSIHQLTKTSAGGSKNLRP